MGDWLCKVSTKLFVCNTARKMGGEGLWYLSSNLLKLGLYTATSDRRLPSCYSDIPFLSFEFNEVCQSLRFLLEEKA